MSPSQHHAHLPHSEQNLLSLVLTVEFVLSSRPFICGWYTDVTDLQMENLMHKSLLICGEQVSQTKVKDIVSIDWALKTNYLLTYLRETTGLFEAIIYTIR